MPKESKESQAWASRARGRYSATRFNGTLETFRRLIKMAIDKGLMLDDTSTEIERASVPIVEKKLPKYHQMPAFINALENPTFEKLRFTDGRANHIEKYRIGRLIRHRRTGGAMLKFMLFTGCRPAAARQAMPGNIDLARNEIILPMVKYDNKPVRVPIFLDAKKFFEQLLKDYPGSGPLLPVGDPSKTLASACKEIGIKKLVPSDMRDLFASIALMHTKDVALVAAWLGHKDGGVTLLKRYAYIFDDYSQALAKKVHFLKTPSPATIECRQTNPNRSTTTMGTMWKPGSKSTWTA